MASKVESAVVCANPSGKECCALLHAEGVRQCREMQKKCAAVGRVPRPSGVLLAFTPGTRMHPAAAYMIPRHE